MCVHGNMAAAFFSENMQDRGLAIAKAATYIRNCPVEPKSVVEYQLLKSSDCAHVPLDMCSACDVHVQCM